MMSITAVLNATSTTVNRVAKPTAAKAAAK